LQRPTILVIDDDRDTLKLLRIALEREGYNILTAANWDETTVEIKKSYDDKRPVDAVVLDLMMPERSGFDILRGLQVILMPLPPVVMLSANTGFYEQVEARTLGANRYLTKPTTPNKLVEAIEGVLAERGTGELSKLGPIGP
jgi:DNA-binding response OmpR family regulator